jgi:hypothetical protein
MLTGLQIRTARKLLGWGVWRLSLKAQVPRSTVERAEKGDDGKAVTAGQQDKIQAALEAAGIEFTNDREPGVKLKAARE